MNRYFIEVGYKGTKFSGFQIQNNAATIQQEVEKALATLFKISFALTGSSRTDAGVHAHQNYFHFDTQIEISNKHIYNLNAIIDNNIVINNIAKFSTNYHCRFDAIAREYQYFIYQNKNPFLQDTAWLYPYPLDINLLNKAASILLMHNNFASFSKLHTQVNNFNCTLFKSEWLVQNNCIIYNVVANRFLRGMVRGLVATMLKVGRKQISISEFENIITSQNCKNAFFETPAKGLFLHKVIYPDNFFDNTKIC
jgi:tRNA pseudouridine38-40 synthase